MKKILLSICLTAISAATFAQSDKSVTFGVKGGVNFATLPFFNIDPLGSTSASTLTNFHIGVFADFKLCKSLSLQPGLLYTGKGGKKKLSFNEEAIKYLYTDTTNINYLQVPVNVIYHVPVGNHSFYIGAGPFVSYAISGRTKSSLTIDGSVSQFYNNEKLTFGSSEPNLAKRWDYGVGALAGFKLDNGLLVNINYDLGLANTTPKSEVNNNKTKTRVFGVSVGYAF